MPLKFLHTADLHLGMTFKNRHYPDEVREQLVEARFDVLAGLVEKAQAEQCQLLIIAGDLFHRANVAPGVVERAVEILERFQGCVALLPGNHDYYEPYGAIWRVLREKAFDGLILLIHMQPYPLHEYGIEAVLYPAPCDRKHSPENRLDWITGLDERPVGRWHIGVAHGTVRGISPDFEKQYFPMHEAELVTLKMDHWCLGHTHVRYPDLDHVERETFIYSGSPEPDGFDCRHGGNAWVTELDDKGHAVSRSIKTGRFYFCELQRQIQSRTDLERVHQELISTTGVENSLVKLKLSGTLPEADYETRISLYNHIRDALLYLEIDDSALAIEITSEVISSNFPEGSFPHRLLTRLAEKDDREALQVAYRLVEGVKQ